MRVTNAMLVNNFLNNLFANQSRLNRLEQQMSSGKKISQPSDDPVVAARALKFRTNISEVEQYDKNITDGSSWVDATESAMANLTEVLQRTRELMVQGASKSKTKEDLGQISQEIKQLRNQVVYIGNSTYAGRYLFSGFKTDQKLFNDYDESDTTNFGKFNVSIDSNLEKIKYEIGIGDSMYVNVCGGEVFNNGGNTIGDAHGKSTGNNDISFPLTIDGAGSNNDTLLLTVDGGAEITVPITNQDYADVDSIAAELQTQINTQLGEGAISVVSLGNKLQFVSGTTGLTSNVVIDTVGTSTETLTDLGLTVPVGEVGSESMEGELMTFMTDIKKNFEDGSSVSIADRLDDIDVQLANVLRVRADLGARFNRLELTATRVASDKVTFTKQMSENEDVDMAEVIMSMQNEENVYKAALGGGAKIIQPTLIDFLR